MDKEIEVEVEPASGRKDMRWKYACLLNEKDTSTHICIFCDKVTKKGICRQATPCWRILKFKKVYKMSRTC